jgi:hypothetical protein
MKVFNEKAIATGGATKRHASRLEQTLRTLSSKNSTSFRRMGWARRWYQAIEIHG